MFGIFFPDWSDSQKVENFQIFEKSSNFLKKSIEILLTLRRMAPSGGPSKDHGINELGLNDTKEL